MPRPKAKQTRQDNIESTSSTYSDAVSLAVHIALGTLAQANLSGGSTSRASGSGGSTLSGSDGSESARNEEGSETHFEGCDWSD